MRRSISPWRSRRKTRRPKSPLRAARSDRRSRRRCGRTAAAPTAPPASPPARGARRGDGCRTHGSAVIPADEALAHVVVEASGRPLVVSNVDLSDARVAGLASDMVATFLRQLAEGAGLTLHVRLIEGAEPEHVLAAIFKALGVALAQSCRLRRTGD